MGGVYLFQANAGVFKLNAAALLAGELNPIFQLDQEGAIAQGFDILSHNAIISTLGAAAAHRFFPSPSRGRSAFSIRIVALSSIAWPVSLRPEQCAFAVNVYLRRCIGIAMTPLRPGVLDEHPPIGCEILAIIRIVVLWHRAVS